MPRRIPSFRWSPLILALALAPTARAGPYSPAAGQPGSDAIAYNDPRFVEWASGYRNYLPGNPINSNYENPNNTLGPPKAINVSTTGNVTQLGDGGQITLTFASPIIASGTGPDFAVFGNAFDDTYLKLSYVDVSDDGVTWFRMPDDSLTPGPIATFGNNMDPTNIFGLAGKYRVGYGTPFSLSEVGLAEAKYVRLFDVVGDGTNLDSAGNPIYDPYPNDDGFNAAGVGVISAPPSSVPEPTSMALMLMGGTIAVVAGHRHRRARARTSDL